MHIQFFLVCREDRKARFGTAELSAFHWFYLTAQRTCRIYHIVDITARHTKMLEVMNVSACIDIHLMFTEDRIQTFLHIAAFTVVFRRFSINGMMPYYDNP